MRIKFNYIIFGSYIYIDICIYIYIYIYHILIISIQHNENTKELIVQSKEERIIYKNIKKLSLADLNFRYFYTNQIKLLKSILLEFANKFPFEDIKMNLLNNNQQFTNIKANHESNVKQIVTMNDNLQAKNAELVTIIKILKNDNIDLKSQNVYLNDNKNIQFQIEMYILNIA